jgi:hypothetical protein
VEQLTVICAHCSGTLYECPLCHDMHHRENVVLSDSDVLCCLECMGHAVEVANDRDALLRWYRVHRERGYPAQYETIRELACA